MDGTTQSHLDPTTLSHVPGQSGELPSLQVNQPSTLGGIPEPPQSEKLGNALDSTEGSGAPRPQSQNPFLSGSASGTNTDLPSSNDIQAKADDVKSQIPSADDIKAKANDAAKSIPSAQDIKNSDTATGIRQRVNTLGNKANANVNQASNKLSHTLDQVQHHPIVENAKEGAQQQVGQFRAYLGRSPTIVNLEKRLNIDRVFLVAGGALLYILLIPLNLFGLALPTTTLLTLAPPVMLALAILDKDNMQDDGKTKSLLAYFVVLGFIQFLESLAAGFLARRIPQYYTLKLVFLAYLLHPQTQGALKFHETVLRPAFSQTTSSKCYSSSSQGYSVNSNTPPQTKPQSGSEASSPFVGQMPVRGTLDAQGNIIDMEPTQSAFPVVAQQ